jgi:hypothetical protein
MAVTEEGLRTDTPEKRVRTSAPEVRTSDSEVRTPDVAELEALLQRAPRTPRMSRQGLAVCWIAVVGALILIAPAPSNTSTPLWAALLSMGFLAAFSVTLWALASDRGWALRASAVTAVAGIGLALACAQTGHHAGSWWAVELVAFAALAGASLLGRARRGTLGR